jgi:hypothetical protein
MGLIAGIRRNERPSIFATHFLVSVMLVCLASLLVQVGQRLAPGWDGRYLVIVAFLAAVESFITKRSLKRASVFSSTWLTRRGIELIVMLVVLKATLYLLRDPSQFWRDLPTWRTDFLNHFFTGEYFVAVMFVILIWLIGGAFTDSLLELEGDAEFIEEEARIGLRSDRPAARQQLTRQFFVVGGIMLALIALLRLDLKILQIGPPIARAGVAELLIYFVLGLALLGQSRFAVLRARWIWDRIPMQANLATPWLIYSVLLLVVLAVVAAFLPTIYSLDLLATLGYLVGLLAYALNFLFFAIVLLVGIMIRFVLSLFGQTQPAPTPAMPPPPLPPLPAPLHATTPWPWFELLKSVFFWAVFIGVIAAALVSYVRQNRELLQSWDHVPILHWLFDRWGWLAARLRRASQQLAALPARLRRSQLTPPAVQGEVWGFVNLRRLSARERVQFYYLAFVRRGREHGLPRQPGQTPLEYATTLSAALPESQPDVAALTASFNEARYSQHEISAGQVGLVQRAWEQIKQALRRGRP